MKTMTRDHVQLSDLKACAHAHTVAATAEEIEGLPEFEKGAILYVVGIDTPVYVGDTQVVAESHVCGVAAGMILKVKLPQQVRTFFLDADTAGLVSIFQVVDMNTE